MTMQDPISDMLTCIRNNQIANKTFVEIPFSNIKISIIKVLKNEGYIKQYEIIKEKKTKIRLELKYFNNQPVIEKINRISKPSLRIYKRVNKLPKIMNGLGIAIISTSKGVMTDANARKMGIGGEIICYVS